MEDQNRDNPGQNVEECDNGSRLVKAHRAADKYITSLCILLNRMEYPEDQKETTEEDIGLLEEVPTLLKMVRANQKEAVGYFDRTVFHMLCNLRDLYGDVLDATHGDGDSESFSHFVALTNFLSVLDQARKIRNLICERCGTDR